MALALAARAGPHLLQRIHILAVLPSQQRQSVALAQRELAQVGSNRHNCHQRVLLRTARAARMAAECGDVGPGGGRPRADPTTAA